MKAFRTVFPKYLRVLLVVSAVVISLPFTTSADQVAKQVGGAGFKLSVDQGTLSLKATNAPLKAILAQIGQDTNIEVDAQVADDETVTDEFRDLLIDDALRRLAPNYAIITGQDDEKITKIVIMPKGEAAGLTAETQQTPVDDGKAPQRSEPFKFEFDPSAVMTTE